MHFFILTETDSFQYRPSKYFSNINSYTKLSLIDCTISKYHMIVDDDNVDGTDVLMLTHILIIVLILCYGRQVLN